MVSNILEPAVSMLEKAGFAPEKAESIVKSVEHVLQVREPDLSLATKADLSILKEELRGDINLVRLENKTEKRTLYAMFIVIMGGIVSLFVQGSLN